MRRLLFALLIVALLLPQAAFAEEAGWQEQASAPPDVGLDPGHSRADVGAVGNGLAEYEVTLDIANRVKAILEEQGATVAMTRLDGEPLTDFSAPDPIDGVRIEQEARISAVSGSRLYVSIHLNGFPDPSVRGAEVYFNSDNNGDESRALAESIHDSLLEEVRGAGYPLADRGVREDLSAGKPYGHFFSLRGPMPSVLVEAMFLTNPGDAGAIADDEIRDAVARGIARGILARLGKGFSSEGQPTDQAASGTTDQYGGSSYLISRRSGLEG